MAAKLLTPMLGRLNTFRRRVHTDIVLTTPVPDLTLSVNVKANFTLQGTNTYLIGRGPRRILLDTGEGKQLWLHSLESTLAAEQATIAHTILTHWHPDHVGGVADLLRMFPGIQIHKNRPDAGQLELIDGQIFTVDGATLRAFHTPGHTVDHTVLILEEEDAMFTGDNVLGHGTAVFEDLPTYLGSLDKMQHQFSGRAYPGHGDVIQNGKAKIQEYIRHRQQREEQIMQLLDATTPAGEIARSERGAEWKSMDMVKVIYKDVPENLHLPAERGLLQVLRKLEGENKVVHQPAQDTWQTTNTPAL
ncbi:MAG: hypothetical protein M1812_000880 [Candelaria pacifica]|nr:MAG: hypothetical protein M1812_000880 [Candelaria pacifica]